VVEFVLLCNIMLKFGKNRGFLGFSKSGVGRGVLQFWSV